MKYKMFRNLLLVGAALSVAGGVFYLGKKEPRPAVVPLAAATIPAAASAPPAPPPAAPPPAAAPATRAPRESVPLRDLDRELLRLYHEGKGRLLPSKAGAPKVKDVFPDRSYKVNLYEEEGRLARAKIDLNRNGKWDEKWTFAPGRTEVVDPVVKRQVSPADDDKNYSLAYKLVDKSWVLDSDDK